MSTTVFHDLLARNLVARPDRVAVLSGEDAISYAELGRRVDRLAGWLHEQGVRRGDRVVVHLRKSVEEVVAMFAVARLGAIFVNIHAQWTVAQLGHVVSDCGATLAIVDRRRAEEVLAERWPEPLRRILVCGDAPADSRLSTWDADTTGDGLPSMPAIDADLAAILYTSGSTGRPRGVMLTHLNLIQGARSVAAYLHNDATDRALSLLPFSFDYGLSQLTTMFLVGGALVLQAVQMPAEIVRTAVAHRCTGLAAVPPTWINLVRFLEAVPTALPDLRYVTNSGGAIPRPILEAMPAVLPGVDIYLMYGLTEAFRSTYLPPELFATKMGSIGRAVPNVETFIVNDTDGICGPGQQGELVHRGSLVSKGYWGQPEATAARIRPCPQLAHLIGDEKVVYSGDLVRIDEDGHYWFVGRMDSMIKCSGFRISPDEVEEIVLQHAAVAEAVAFGVADELLGQVVHVAVSAAPGATLETADLAEFCRRRMPHYMIPRKIHALAGPLPRTGNGKFDVARISRLHETPDDEHERERRWR